MLYLWNSYKGHLSSPIGGCLEWTFACSLELLWNAWQVHIRLILEKKHDITGKNMVRKTHKIWKCTSEENRVRLVWISSSRTTKSKKSYMSWQVLPCILIWVSRNESNVDSGREWNTRAAYTLKSISSHSKPLNAN